VKLFQWISKPAYLIGVRRGLLDRRLPGRVQEFAPALVIAKRREVEVDRKLLTAKRLLVEKRGS
jgi:hypothetical protein